MMVLRGASARNPDSLSRRLPEILVSDLALAAKGMRACFSNLVNRLIRFVCCSDMYRHKQLIVLTPHHNGGMIESRSAWLLGCG
jgi:hypothetical protein